MTKQLLINILIPMLAGFPLQLQAQKNASNDSPKHSRPQGPRNENPQERRNDPKQHNPNDRERILLLKRLLELPPERLDALRATVDRIRRLSAEEKRALKERLDNYSRLDEQERRRLLEDFRETERKRWDDFDRRYKHLPKDQRQREQLRIHSLPLHERRAYFEQLRRNKHPKGGPGPHRPTHPQRREGPPHRPPPRK